MCRLVSHGRELTRWPNKDWLYRLGGGAAKSTVQVRMSEEQQGSCAADP